MINDNSTCFPVLVHGVGKEVVGPKNNFNTARQGLWRDRSSSFCLAGVGGYIRVSGKYSQKR